MSNNHHVIEQIHFALKTHTALAAQIQQRCSQVFYRRLKTLFDELLTGAQLHHADRYLGDITINLGEVPLLDFEEQLYRGIKSQLTSSLEGIEYDLSAERDIEDADERSALHEANANEKSAALTAEDDKQNNALLIPTPPDTPPFTLLCDFLASGVFARPHEWTTAKGPDGWLKALLLSHDNGGHNGLTHLSRAAVEHARYELAQYVLQARAHRRLTQTFGEAARARLQEWIAHGLTREEHLALKAQLPDPQLTETALFFMQKLSQQNGQPAFTLPAQAILWPTRPGEWQRWLGVLLAASTAHSRILLSTLQRLEQHPRLSVTIISGLSLRQRDRLLPLMQLALGFLDAATPPTPAAETALQREFPALLAIERGVIPFRSTDRHEGENEPAFLKKTPTTQTRAAPAEYSPETADNADDDTPLPTPTKAAPHEALAVSNAGICLLWPLLPMLLTQLGLLVKNRFVSEEARNQAVCCLDHLVWQDDQTAEWRTGFTQWLCGWPEDTPLEWQLPDDRQRLVIDNFLQALPQMMPSLHRCAPLDIQQFFLQRGGALSHTARGWALETESEAIDILLRDLPWPMRELYFPWLADRLTVDWL